MGSFSLAHLFFFFLFLGEGEMDVRIRYRRLKGCGTLMGLRAACRTTVPSHVFVVKLKICETPRLESSQWKRGYLSSRSPYSLYYSKLVITSKKFCYLRLGVGFIIASSAATEEIIT